MFLRYKGKTKDFKYLGYDFSKEVAEVPDVLGKQWLKESPDSFTQVVPVVSQAQLDKEAKEAEALAKKEAKEATVAKAKATKARAAAKAKSVAKK